MTTYAGESPSPPDGIDADVLREVANATELVNRAIRFGDVYAWRMAATELKAAARSCSAIACRIARDGVRDGRDGHAVAQDGR